MFPLRALLVAVLPSSCSYYFYVLDINHPRRFVRTALTADTVDEVSQQIDDHQGTFRQILLTPDKVVFFFSFEKSEMKPASSACIEDFSLLRTPLETFPNSATPLLNISLCVTILGVAPSQAQSVLQTTSAEIQKASALLDSALSGTTLCSKQFLQELKAINDRTTESVTWLSAQLCETVPIPEILTTSYHT